MPSYALFTIAVIVPAALALPVPQFGGPTQGSVPVGTAIMGGLTSSITTENGGFSSAGPPQPNCREWQQGCQGYNYPSNNNGGGWGWRGNSGKDNNWPSAGNAYDNTNNNHNNNNNNNNHNNNNNNNNGWNNGYQGGETSTIVTTSGPRGITSSSSSQSYKKTKRHEPEPKQSMGYGSWLNGLFSNYGLGKPTNAPVGTATMGGLTSSITLGGHKKRQIATGSEGSGVTDLGGLESSIALEKPAPSDEQSKPAFDGEYTSYEGDTYEADDQAERLA